MGRARAGVVASARIVLSDRVVGLRERRDLRGERRELVARPLAQHRSCRERERLCLAVEARLLEPEDDRLEAQKLDLEVQRECLEVQKLERDLVEVTASRDRLL